MLFQLFMYLRNYLGIPLFIQVNMPLRSFNIFSG